MRLNLKRIKTFAKCPALHDLEQKYGAKEIELEIVSIVKQVIAKSYARSAETGYRATWKEIISWTDKVLFKDIDMNDDHIYRSRLKTSEYCLTFLRKWYYNLYNQDAIGYLDLYLAQNILHTDLSTNIDIITISDSYISILEVSDTEKSRFELINDVVLRGKAYMLASALGQSEIKVIYLRVSTLGAYERTEVCFQREDHERFRKHLESIILNIKQGAKYPSTSIDCRECRFRRRCKL